MADGMTPDFSSMSDEQLQALAGGQPPAATPPAAPAAQVAPAAPAMPDFSKMTDQELEAMAGQGKTLSNAPGEGTESALAKGVGTAAIKGGAGIVGMPVSIMQTGDYLMARAQQALGMGNASDILANQEKDRKEFAAAHPYLKYLADPMNFLPSQEDVQAPILARTGEYKPTSGIGQAAMAGTEAAVNIVGTMGLGEVGAGAKLIGEGAKLAPTFLDTATNVAKQAAKVAPTAFASGVAGDAATQATGDPLAGLAAGIAVPAVGGKIVSGITSPVKKYLAPIMPGQRAGIAEEKLLSQATSPEEAIAAGAAGPRPDAFGPETLGEASGDVGLLQAQKVARTTSPQFAAAMLDREAQQNASRLGAIQGLAPEAADVMKPSAVLAQHNANIDAAEQAAIQSLQNNADAIHASMPEGTAPEETGSAIRSLQQEVANAARDTRSDLYKAVDPDGRLSVVTQNAAQAAKDLQSTIDPSVTLASPHAAPVINMVANLSDVTPYSKLIELDKTITAKMAEANRSGDYVGNGQLRQMKQAVMNDINNAVDNQHAWEQAGVQEGRIDPANTIAERFRQLGTQLAGTAGEAGGESAARAAATGTTGLPPEGVGQRPGGGGLPGAEGNQGVPGSKQTPTNFQGDLNNYTIFHPKGQLQARYELADAKDLVTSHDTDFRENPSYPQQLQSRDRGAVESQNQINQIANRLNPELLGPSKQSAFGAPIVGPDNIVESGNGRTLGIVKAYETGKGEAYRQWLEKNGYDTTGMEKPVLIARRTSAMTPEERQIFAESSNSSTGLKMNAGEQAESDAKMISNMRTPLEPGDISSAANRPFIREFLSKIPENERGSILDADGVLSSDGERRIAAAVTRRAYGDSSLIDRAFVSGDNNMKNVTGALADTAGVWHEMRQAAANGEIPAEHDVTKQIMDTVKQIMRAKDEGKNLGDVLSQADMFRDPESDAVRKFFAPDGKKLVGRAKIAENLQNYAEQALKNRTETTMFGEALPPVKTQDILDNIVKKIEKETPAAEQAPAAAPEAEAEAPAAPKEKAKPFLTPNFNEEAANRLAEAKKAHADYAQTYRKGPVGQILKEDGFQGQYKVLDSAVVNKAFTTGDKGYQATKAFIDAAKRGDVDNTAEVVSHLKDAAVSKLRDMMKGADYLTPKVLQQWQQKYAQSLRAIDEASPGFTKKLSNIADATDAVAKAQARADGITKSSSLGVAGKLINANTPDEVKAAVGNMIRASDGPTQIKNLITRIKQDPTLPGQEAIDGLRRAGVQHIMDSLLNNGMAGEEHILSSAKLRNFMNSNRDSLRALYGDDGLANMNRLLADMERSQQALDAVKVKYGSDTAQNKSFIAKAMEAGGHNTTVGGAFALAGLEAYQHFGVAGALGVGAAAAAKALVGKLRANGIENVNKLYEEGLLDPKVGAAMMQRALDARGQIKIDALNRLAARIAASSEGAAQAHKDQEAKREDLLQRKALGRASGGRVSDISDRLISAAEKAKKAESNQTESFLNIPDDYIAHALNVAQAAI